MKVIEDRRSVRKYKNKEIDDDIILKVLDSARMAPSGSNTQPWNFIIIKSEEMKNKIVKVDHNQKWMLQAPVFIVCVADIKCRIEENTNVILNENSELPELKLIIRDTAIAIEHILLQAEELGLCTCWTGWFSQEDIREVLNIPGDKYVCGVVTMGYGDESPKKRPRRSLDEILRYEKWN